MWCMHYGEAQKYNKNVVYALWVAQKYNKNVVYALWGGSKYNWKVVHDAPWGS